ncbi:MAG: peptidase M22 [Oscillospiraceae bacterium]|nr:peptidase M22 [Candidatus Ruminococcus equi]
MSIYLGIDTSNYTTSVSLYDNISGNAISKRKLLPVKDGELGIRQNDAVFHHTQQLPQLISELFSEKVKIDAVGVSSAPRSVENSYMPCFTVGTSLAKSIGKILDIPVYENSHQQGHIVSALYSINRLDLIDEPHIAFHVSGGTTEAILVNFDGFMSTKIIGGSSDLNAGQLVDRVGVMLGLSFPCGKELEKLAEKCNEEIKLKPSINGFHCSLSGFENKAKALFEQNYSKEYIAKYVLKAIENSLAGILQNIILEYGEYPVVFAGGVMSNSIIRNSMTKRFDCMFSLPEYSTDNAVGVAVLTSYKDNNYDNT